MTNPLLRFAIGTAALAIATLKAAAAPGPVALHWLGDSPAALQSGVSWGVPWPKASVDKAQRFVLKAPDGTLLPLQTWPLAYWPDGSVKWSGFATVVPANLSGDFTLAAAEGPAGGPTAGVRVSDTPEAVEIDTGALQCRILKKGSSLIDTLTVSGRVVARQGRLVSLLQKGSANDVDASLPVERFAGDIDRVTVEQSGPHRAVVKVEGRHRSESGDRVWLPFTVRLYFYAGALPIRVVHTFLFDGDHQTDFLRGLGLTFAVPMREEVQNRHVRLSGDGAGISPSASGARMTNGSSTRQSVASVTWVTRE